MKSCIIITKPSIDELTKAKTATYGRQSIVPRNDVADDEEVSAQLRRLQGDRSVPSSYRRPYQSRTRRNNRNNEDSSDSSDDDSSDDDGVVFVYPTNCQNKQTFQAKYYRDNSQQIFGR